MGETIVSGFVRLVMAKANRAAWLRWERETRYWQREHESRDWCAQHTPKGAEHADN